MAEYRIFKKADLPLEVVILSVAGEVVSNNEGRLGKTLIAERGGGKKPDQSQPRHHKLVRHAHLLEGERRQRADHQPGGA